MAVTRRRIVVTVVVLALVVPIVAIAATAAAVWNAAHTDDASTIDRTDAIIVLGAAQYQGQPSPVFAGRLDHAKMLFDTGRASRILAIGAGQPGERTTEAEAGRTYLLEQGVPEWAVIVIPEGSTTFESLQAATRYLRDQGLDSAFLVSDPWHNLRIKRMAHDLGIQGYASATWHSAATSQPTRGEGYLREVFAYLYYRMLGR